MHLTWPWQGRNRKLSWLKTSTFTLTFVPAIWLLYQIVAKQFGPVPLGGMTYWSGLWALAFLMLALAVTPATTILRWNQLVIVRRMVGVTSLVYTIAHIIIYFALRFWNFAAITHEMATRVSLILATVATIGLLALGATSFDLAIRRMGARGWQKLHSIIYATAALALIHYLLSPDMYPEQYLMSGMFFWLMAWRALNRRGLGADPIVLVVLAFVASLFTAFFEAGWTWIYHGYEPSWTLGNNFSLDLGVSAAWKILMLGFLVAMAAAARWSPRLRTA